MDFSIDSNSANVHLSFKISTEETKPKAVEKDDWH